MTKDSLFKKMAYLQCTSTAQITKKATVSLSPLIIQHLAAIIPSRESLYLIGRCASHQSLSGSHQP